MHFTPLPLIRVFLAADDEDDCKLVRALLAKSPTADYSLEWEASFEGFLSRVNGFAHDIYLIVCHSGKNNGLELIGKMIANGCRKPIIRVTDQPGHDSDVRAMNAGASGCLRKAQLQTRVLDRAILRAIEGKRDESAFAGIGEEWECTLDAMCDLIMIIDRQFRIRRINKGMAERLGMRPEVLLGKVCHEVVHGLDSPPAYCPHVRVLKLGMEQFGEVYEKRLGGHLSVSASPCYDGQGRLVGSILVIRDINISKAMEEKFRSVVERLEGRLAAQAGELRAKAAGIKEMDTAMKVLLRRRELDRKDVEESVAANITGALMPFLVRLKKTVLTKNQMACLDSIECGLKEIASPFLREISRNGFGLTPMEVQIVTLLRVGKTSKEVAQALNVSINTVKFHRMNIRRKLGLNGRKSSLKARLGLNCKSMVLPYLFSILFLSFQDIASIITAF
ncbi:MAG: LuxR C-terminal-related transcriptional regulator [Syntrophobacteraceae bacterium]